MFKLIQILITQSDQGLWKIPTDGVRYVVFRGGGRCKKKHCSLEDIIADVYIDKKVRKGPGNKYFWQIRGARSPTARHL